MGKRKRQNNKYNPKDSAEWLRISSLPKTDQEYKSHVSEFSKTAYEQKVYRLFFKSALSFCPIF